MTNIFLPICVNTGRRSFARFGRQIGDQRGRLEMRILAISDLHGDLNCVARASSRVRPDVIVSCGDWGDAEQVGASDFAMVLEVAPVYTTYGNHDPLDLLARLRNRDGSPVLLEQGTTHETGGLRIAAIGGIWAKSHRQPYYVTDSDVAAAANRIREAGPVDILLTHGCPIGVADLTPSGRHGGQRCFLDAYKTIAPRLLLCGHLHRAQEYRTKDGRQALNVGATPEGSIVVVDFDPKERTLDARLEALDAS
jgi:uncharacterized protein